LPACRRARAFTLIELLVVVAVIGVLASLIMPAILSSVRSAQTARCQSNLRQIHAAMMHYARSYDTLIVPLGNFPTMSPYFIAWSYLLEPYVRDRNVYKCSTEPRAEVAYGMNYRVVGGVNEMLSLFQYPQALPLVRKPSLSFIFCDAGCVANPDDHPDKWVQGPDTWTGLFGEPRCYARFPLDVVHNRNGYYISYFTKPSRALPRHPGHKTNCVYFDGHVAGLPTWDLVDDEYGELNCLYDNQ
jgi:prepilin-type N-terminal cleavage/methylation domain-containing protein/prepilin-type processing-associated H-X9-DG protein